MLSELPSLITPCLHSRNQAIRSWRAGPVSRITKGIEAQHSACIVKSAAQFRLEIGRLAAPGEIGRGRGSVCGHPIETRRVDHGGQRAWQSPSSPSPSSPSCIKDRSSARFGGLGAWNDSPRWRVRPLPEQTPPSSMRNFGGPGSGLAGAAFSTRLSRKGGKGRKVSGPSELFWQLPIESRRQCGGLPSCAFIRFEMNTAPGTSI
jgi:hypothetical protein